MKKVTKIVGSIRGAFKSSEDLEGEPSIPQPPSAEPPANILAFRTITTLLSLLPRTTPIAPSDNLEGQIDDPAIHQEIKISDAFAHLAAGEHDIAALTTNRSCPDGTSNFKVLASSNKILDSTPTISPKPDGPISSLGVWYLRLTRNFLRNEAPIETLPSTPYLISSLKPEGLLGDQSALDYMKGLKEHW